MEPRDAAAAVLRGGGGGSGGRDSCGDPGGSDGITASTARAGALSPLSTIADRGVSWLCPASVTEAAAAAAARHAP
ncbi:hypothetical protein MMPV_002113 [Pyropia vietnamensis]